MKAIKYVVGVGIRGPIAPEKYDIGDAVIDVSYPETIDLAGRKLALPKWLSTVFTVSWSDADGKDAAALASEDGEQHLIIYKVLGLINKLVQPFKLVRIDHIDSAGLRTIGLHDTLFYYVNVDNTDIGHIVSLMRGQFSAHLSPDDIRYNDYFGTTPMARPHIGAEDFPVARRFLRCYELLEHGFYSEAFIVAFSILDAIVQDMLKEKLTEKGMMDKNERQEFMRGIKENRLRMFLGPLLYILSGKSIASLWPSAEAALTWINSRRNNIVHNGQEADYSVAAQGIFACIKILSALDEAGLVIAKFAKEFLKHAEVTAVGTASPPSWISQTPTSTPRHP